MDMSQYRDLFLAEAREHLNAMNAQVVALEQSPDDRSTIDALFREAHSLKGMAATMGFMRTAELAHRLEDCLDDFRKAGWVPVAVLDPLLAGLDLLEGLVDDIEAGHPERDTAGFLESEALSAVSLERSTDGAPVPGVEDIPRLSLEDPEENPSENHSIAPQRLEEQVAFADQAVSPEPETFQILVTLVADAAVPAARALLLLRGLEAKGELISVDPDKQSLLGGGPCHQLKAWFRTALDHSHIREFLLACSDVEGVEFVFDRRKEGSGKTADGGRSVRVRTELLDRFVNLAGELLTHRHVLRLAARRRDWDDMQTALEQTSKLVDSLHHHVLRTRLVPLESIAGRLPRIVRDLGRKAGKQVVFRLVGGEVGLDRVILDELADPLVHLVRNAVDHGIREEGEVVVSARRDRDLVLVEVRDNGCGMDPCRLRETAVERGILSSAQAASLTDRDALLLICRPGFSTAEQVTETSGRGVGMDVVKAAVENLGGTLSIRSAPDKGTCFQMHLPLSIAIVKLIVVRCAGLPLALPVTRVQRIVELPRTELEPVDGELFFRLHEEPIRIVSLAEALGMANPPLAETVCLVIAELHGAPIGLLVDGFVGHRDAFVKNLGFPLNLFGGLSGATIEGDGSVLFIIDPQTLLDEHPAEVVA